MEIQRRISDIKHSVGPDNFSIQNFLVLLESGEFLTSTTIVCIPKYSPLWLLVQDIFRTSYFDQIKSDGGLLMSSMEQVKFSDPVTLQLKSKSLETQDFFVDGKMPFP